MIIDRPRLEGTIAVGPGRRLSFAEFGTPRGRPVIWMHGTPGGRRQIPLDARAFAEEHDLRIIGIDRPGIGSSTPYLYQNIADWTSDLEVIAYELGVDTMSVVGLSGGGPYALAAGAMLPDRVQTVGVLGGVAPTRGVDKVTTGLVPLAARFGRSIESVRLPLGAGLTGFIQTLRPLAGLAIDLYASVQPKGDKELLGRPEFRAMFLDDLVGGTRKQATAPLTDLVLFTKHWGFEAADVVVPVHWWHGDQDPIVPAAHGLHMVQRLPNATMRIIEDGSHLCGLATAREVLQTLAK